MDNLAPTTGCPSDFALDAYLAAGGPAEHPLHRHVQACPACQERLQAHEQARVMFEREVYPATVDEVADRLAKSRGSWWRSQFPVLLAAAASVLLVLIVWFQVDPQGGRDESYVGVKGAVGMQVFVRRGGETFRAGSGDTLLAGDMLRFVVAPSSAGYLMIVSVPPRGDLSVYWPAEEGVAGRVDAGEAPLPGSVVLDDQAGPERIIVVWRERPFDEHMVRLALQRARAEQAHPALPDRLPLDAAQTSLVFYKKRR